MSLTKSDFPSLFSVQSALVSSGLISVYPNSLKPRKSLSEVQFLVWNIPLETPFLHLGFCNFFSRLESDWIMTKFQEMIWIG